MRLFAASLLGGVMMVAAVSASADEMRLSDAQMDFVTAGAGNTLVPGTGIFSVFNQPQFGQAALLTAGLLADQYVAQTEQPLPTSGPFFDILNLLVVFAADRGVPPPTTTSAVATDTGGEVGTLEPAPTLF